VLWRLNSLYRLKILGYISWPRIYTEMEVTHEGGETEYGGPGVDGADQAEGVQTTG
jgi:hypothetical protein